MLDGRLDEVDALLELPGPGSDDVVRLGHAEGNEQQTRLVNVRVVLVHHGDLQVAGAVVASEAVRRERSAGAASEDHDASAQGSSVCVADHL